MQQVWNVPEELLVDLPRDLPLRDAALVEPVAVAHHDVVRPALGAGRALVVGGGPIGVLIAVVARARGAEVLVAEPDAYRRSVVAGLGLDVVDPRAVELYPALDAWSQGAGADGDLRGVRHRRRARPRAGRTRHSRSARRGRHPCGPSQVDMKRVFWKELAIFGARVYERTDFTAAVELLAEGAIPVDALVSTTAALADAPAAFESLAQGGRVMKVLLDCREEGAA